MSEESQLPDYGWLHPCIECGIITSKYITKTHLKFNKKKNNSDIIYICSQCQKNNKLVENIGKYFKTKIT